MEGERTEGDELIDDYVDCLMSLDTNARAGPSDGLILGAPVVEGAVGGGTEPDAMRDFASAEDPKEPVLGMTFQSDEAAKAFYNEYAKRLGFPFRVGRSRRSKGTEEVVVMKRFVCSREGVYKKKQTSPDEATRKRERMSMREGCNAMMEVVRDSDHWVVSKLEKAHNHDLGTCSTNAGYLRARGILCRHILGVYIIVDPHTLPPDYLLRRWTRKARDDDALLEENNNHHDGDPSQSITSRYNVLCVDAIRCAEKGAVSEAVYKAAKDILQKAYQEIIAYERNPGQGSQRDAININEDVTIDDAMNDQSMPDSGRKVTNLLGQFLDSSWSPIQIISGRNEVFVASIEVLYGTACMSEAAEVSIGQSLVQPYSSHIPQNAKTSAELHNNAGIVGVFE
ncbi:protein FAR1-RELATED SEQUENCE 5-like [Panicum miliaceum]|uniref:Protein FAR1-RELATED SEQUENCE n=1 Tax=Panicum miliaceum TaxID=4540 RepID=A0A3L6SU11_PANMI|nr:protein FAR1-RELATED SEQUENCE 5-like [Panicum miliaceum]